MEAAGVRWMSVVGLSYGGFVVYCMAAQFPKTVERVVIGCAGVCLEEKDMDDGLFKVKSVDEVIEILLAETPAKLRELMRLFFYTVEKEFAVPKCYELAIKLDLSASTFSGCVAIHVSINGSTKFLILNALELAIHQVSFTSSQKQKYVPSDILVDSDDEILVLVFEEVLEVEYGLLEIEFSGVLNEHLQGLYRCTYSDKGEKKNMVATSNSI
ncbi:alpha/beta-Hydrolases superfamily protein [Perilla frutescens var. frutescens]|nr:alpha/beta-Hydrolases superfamily protein [Perilla frutescens var. frutescens]